MADQGTKKAGLPEAPTDAFEDTAALRDAGQRLLGLLVQQSAEAATRRVNGLA